MGTTALADVLGTPTTVGPGPQCSVGKLLARLDPGDRDLVTAALDNPEIQHTDLGRRLKKGLGVTVGAGTISRHRRNDCACSA